MYKTHCQCILDTAINANFDEVSFNGFLKTMFWLSLKVRYLFAILMLYYERNQFIAMLMWWENK